MKKDHPATKPKTRSGRQTRKKLHMVTTAYDDTELAELDERASRAGMTRASFQRVQSLATAPKTRSTRKAPVEKEMLAKILGQLGRMASNLNQVTHQGHLGLSTSAEVKAEISALRSLRGVILESMGRKS